MKSLRLSVAAAAVVLATAPLAAPADAVVCEFPMSVVCTAHGVACQHVPDKEIGRTSTHMLLCTVVM